MPNKQVHFDIKVWTLADSMVKYVWTFGVYYSKKIEDFETCVVHVNIDSKNKSRKVKGKQGKMVVKELTTTLYVRGHIVIVDNFFTSMLLFMDLVDLGTIARGP